MRVISLMSSDLKFYKTYYLFISTTLFRLTHIVSMEKFSILINIIKKFISMQDPNADINEMFDMVEQVASAPAKFLTKFLKR
jgi:hypothetical protein